MSETQGLTEDEVDILVSSAVTAPSMHNTQPWRFDVVGSVVDVILDDDRTLPAEDSSGRLIRIGLGAATFNVRVAAAMLGHETTLAIDPDPARPDIVARVFLGQRQGRVELGSLYGELRRRHTYRGPMMENVVAQRVRERITGSVKGEGANLHWLDAGCRHGLRVILREADELDVHDEDRLTERAGWIGGRRSEDGVPDSALGPRPSQPAAVRDLAAGSDVPGRPLAVFENDPLIAVLATPGDAPSDWLLAGMALQHGLLTATSYDVAASFLSQPLERPPLRARVRELIAQAGHPQQVIRFGYPADHGSGTPRRSWRESLTRSP